MTLMAVIKALIFFLMDVAMGFGEILNDLLKMFEAA